MYQGLVPEGTPRLPIATIQRELLYYYQLVSRTTNETPAALDSSVSVVLSHLPDLESRFFHL